MDALSSPTRLDLLLQLQHPRASSEIHLKPESVRPGEDPLRNVSRQGVELHLKKLQAAGLVSARVEYRGRRRVNVHVLERQRLEALLGQLRILLPESAGQLA